jgi:hypothetical protein
LSFVVDEPVDVGVLARSICAPKDEVVRAIAELALPGHQIMERGGFIAARRREAAPVVTGAACHAAGLIGDR